MTNDNNIYYNVEIRNNTTEAIPAVFSENRVKTILEQPDKWEAAVVRFSIPSDSLKIFKFVDGSMNVTLRDQQTNANFTRDLIWIPQSLEPGSRDVFSYNSIVIMLNNALSLAFGALKSANPGSVGTVPPFFTLNSATGLFEMYTEKIWNGPTGILLSSNFKMFSLLEGFSTFAEYGTIDPNSVYTYNQINTEVNTVSISGVDYLKTLSEYSTIASWSDLSKIEIASNVPVRAELIGGTSDITSRIFTDFIPNVSVNNRESFQYIPAQFRWYDMTSNYPLTRMDLTVRYRYLDDTTETMQISPGEAVSVKILFRRKSFS
jgi:hypothetical protein